MGKLRLTVNNAVVQVFIVDIECIAQGSLKKLDMMTDCRGATALSSTHH